MFFTTESQEIKTMDDIQDIFDESAESKTEIFISSEDGNYNLNGRPFPEDSETGRISTLSELFTEWYLFDSSHEKNVQQFLAEEDLTDVFTESEFMDLMCGGAYLDDRLIHFIALKIPFQIKEQKIQKLNRELSEQNNKANLIKSKNSTIEKTRDIIAERKTNKQKHDKEYRIRNREHIIKQKREYYLLNRERILERNRQWVLAHQEQCQAYYQKWREENAEHLKEYHKNYRTKNATAVSERKKKCYNSKKAQYQQRNKENYEKRKQLAEAAQNVCVVYIFLLNLRKADKKLYTQLYTRQQNPLTEMIKTCTALQKMNMNMCPFCNRKSSQKLDQCCNQKVLELANAKTLLKILANTLKQR